MCLHAQPQAFRQLAAKRSADSVEASHIQKRFRHIRMSSASSSITTICMYTNPRADPHSDIPLVCIELQHPRSFYPSASSGWINLCDQHHRTRSGACAKASPMCRKALGIGLPGLSQSQSHGVDKGKNHPPKGFKAGSLSFLDGSFCRLLSAPLLKVTNFWWVNGTRTSWQKVKVLTSKQNAPKKVSIRVIFLQDSLMRMHAHTYAPPPAPDTCTRHTNTQTNTHTHTHTHTDRHANTDTQTQTRKHRHANTDTDTDTQIHTLTHPHTHTPKTHTHTHAHQTYTHTHTCACAPTHARTHTHTHGRERHGTERNRTVRTHAFSHAHTHAQKQTNKQTNQQASKQTKQNKLTSKPANKQIHTHTHTHTHKWT